MSAKTTNVNQSHETSHKQPAPKPMPKGPAALTSSATPESLQRALADPSQAQPVDILALQRMAGNRAVSRLIQTKLTVGPAGDRYEQEADRVAAQVMAMPTPAPADTRPAVQRVEEEEELQMKPVVQRVPEEEEDLQMKPLAAPLAASITPLVQRHTDEEVQPKLIVQRAEEEELQTKPIVQRALEEEEEIQAKPQIQRATSDAGFEVSGDFEQQLSASRGGGSPLPATVRQFMEPRFGADFSGVRIHTGDESAQLNRSVSAQAFTHGRDIYLGEGKSDLESEQGKQLLAHELTHVVQQTGGAVQRLPLSAQPKAPLANISGGDRAIVVQRAISLGMWTGWGFPRWVEGGKELWDRLDEGFNTNLLALKKSLDAAEPKKPAIKAALKRINNLIAKWDNKSIYFKATPPAQAISAAELANEIEDAVKAGRAALAPEPKPAQPDPTPKPEPKKPVVSTPKEQAVSTPKSGPKKSVVSTPKPADIPPVVAVEPEAAVTPPEKSEPKQEVTPPVVSVEPTAAVTQPAPPKKQAEKRPPQKSKKELEAERQEQARLANEAKKVALAKRRAKVAEFGATLKKETEALIASEKIVDFKWTWSSDLDGLIEKVKQNSCSSDDAVFPALQKVYQSWTKTLDEKRAANELERRGTKAQWQTWTGLDDYKVINDLPGAEFKPAQPPPVQGPVTEQGRGPDQVFEPQPDEIPIHVTFDLNSVWAPRGPINGLTAPDLVNILLAGPYPASDTFQRIHATLEANPPGVDNPHVYWGGSDLRTGTRYFQWSSIPDGWTPGPDGPARPKVDQVLNDYVADVVVDNVQRHLPHLMFKVYTWKTFDDLKPAPL